MRPIPDRLCTRMDGRSGTLYLGSDAETDEHFFVATAGQGAVDGTRNIRLQAGHDSKGWDAHMTGSIRHHDARGLREGGLGEPRLRGKLLEQRKYLALPCMGRP